MFIDNICRDPRQPNLGYRMYTASGVTGQTFEADSLMPRELEYYDLLRFAYQIPEFEEVYASPPQKNNFDLFKGSLDLRKGCFLGQELTARTSYNGVSQLKS